MKKNKGITLIALVITIIVLIILAGISINLVLGKNGILNKANHAKVLDNHAKVYETIQTNGMEYWIEKETENKEGDVLSYLQEKEIASASNVVNIEALLGRTLSTGNGTGDSDIYVLEKIEETDSSNNYVLVYYDKNKIRTEIGEIVEEKSKKVVEGMYNEPGAEEKIAPMDLFEYEIISDSQVASTTKTVLPMKEARIIGIKPEYCNRNGYNYKTGECDVEDTNYSINYKGTEISDLLVIPYQVEIDNELYRITEVTLNVKDDTANGMLPLIETLVYPNTVKKIDCGGGAYGGHHILKKVVLSNQLEEIPRGAFYWYPSLTEVIIPEGVSNIGTYAFSRCKLLTNITLPNSIKNIESKAFEKCDALTDITIPKGVTNLDTSFWYCSSLTNITIPENVVNINSRAFEGCTKLTSINIAKEEGSIAGAPWKAPDTAIINWDYKEE